jgi:hypothetical protein
MIKKVIYGGLFTLAGTESIMVANRFYELYKANRMFCSGGVPILPYWLLIEGSVLVFLPVLIKIFKLTNKGGTIADDTELAEMIKEYNKENK